MVYIYILKLQNNKYYVGKTNKPDFRIEEHFNNNGSYFTQMYNPISIEKIYENCDDFDEDKYTKMYMMNYGIDNVRGGSYVQLNLTDDVKEHLNKEILGSTNKCFHCGATDHFVANCEKKRAEGFKKYKGPICYKCGRPGHLVEQCFAKRHIDGSELDFNNCYGCGKRGHWKLFCREKTDLYGRSLTGSCIIM